MQKNRLLGVALLATATVSCLTGCGKDKEKGTLSVWVGNESATFYQTVCNEFLQQNPDFNYVIEVKGVDTGTAGGSVVEDPASCADIYTIAHDNVDKVAKKNGAKPLTDQSLLDQIEADNPAAFKSVIKSTLTSGGETYTMAAPYISQALFLYYNKDKVTEEEVKTFEGIQAAAARAGANVKAVTLLGQDGFNYSFNLLARKASDNSTTLKLYEGVSTDGCYCQGDDEIASLRWAQRFFAGQDDANAHGGRFSGDTNWSVLLEEGQVLSLVGGAWNYNAAKAALGSKLGITVLPTYTLTASDVEGLTDGIVEAGTVMQAGTFADCKVFCLNGTSSSDKYVPAQKLIKYLTSKEIQNRSFKEAANIPAYSGANEYIESIKDEIETTLYQMATSQIKMNEYGIAQPFVKSTYNTYYYSLQAPDFYKNAVLNVNNEFGTLEAVRRVLYRMQYTWQKGVDLILLNAQYLVDQGANIIILGSGEKNLEDAFQTLRDRYPNQVGIYIGYNDALAHQIYSGLDFFLMPSLFEPCGIGQIIAQRYGALPVVRETGGLKDTVHAEIDGFSFAEYNPHSMYCVLKRTLEVYKDKNFMGKLIKQAMSLDRSWLDSMNRYIEVYKESMKK